ncbi:prolyl oligopeptidase family serine peptidase [Pyxidicoccus xibeiensis]|uniref:prolyl oligopeptidase family serine peptidase n=1 Tax=Pyxidicoccus xibeiensis TaxID=2906759 RepID=UPI0020A77C02|nr:prolyl oligopeptidase family serine peptidase [Pyxidicoccus xibeiensis]MCP3144714.1 prolyl oligopeptidase family serine peptidase [Pyxidicoccus xibeiensis]
MTRLRPPLSVLLLALAFALPALAAEPSAAQVEAQLAELRKVTAYDAKAPLDVKTVRTQKRGEATVTELTYASPKGGLVPAYLVTPPGPGPFAAVVFLHWGQGTRNEFLDEALALSRAGVVSLLVDAPHVRPAPWTRPVNGPRVHDAFVQAVVDLRRGVDLLTARPEVDGQRVGYVGHSLGGTVGGAFVGAEPRLRAAVFMAGIGDYSASILKEEGLTEKFRREGFTQKRFDAFMLHMAVLDGVVGVRAAAHPPLFFQYARSDEWVTYSNARVFIDAASEPKLSKFYEGGHELSDAARRDRAQWLRTHLGFAEVPFPGLPVIANPTAPELQGKPIPDWAKVRPAINIPGMEELQVRRGLTYTRVGTRDYKLDLYIPEVASHTAVPVVVLVHGAMHPALAAVVRDLPAFAGQARWVAAQGYIVAVPELGAPATGPAREQWFADVASVQQRMDAALAFLRREAPKHAMNADRTCLWVLSGGGLWGLSPALKKQPPAGLRCVAAWYPLLDAPALPKGTGPREALGTVDAKKLPPLLVVRAGRDSPELNAALDAFVQDAKGRGAPLTLMELPEAHHGFELTDDVERSREAMRQTVRFFEEHLFQ